MRRRAEIAHQSARGALHATEAAHEAAREAVAVAEGLTLSPDEAEPIRRAAREHLQRIVAAVAAMRQAVLSSQLSLEAARAVESSRLGLPVLRA